MSIVLSLQNLTQIFWTIILALNLYVLFLLYRMSRLYRAERDIKLIATANLKESIEIMRTNISSSAEDIKRVARPRLRSCLRASSNVQDPTLTQSQSQSQSQLQSSSTTQDDVRFPRKQPAFRQQTTQQKQKHQQQQQHNQAHQQRKNNLVPPTPPRPSPVKSPINKLKEITSSSSMRTKLSDDNRCTPHPDDEHTLYISDSFGRVVHEIPFRERDYIDALYSVVGDQRWNVDKRFDRVDAK